MAASDSFDFEDCMVRLRSRDPATYEDAYEEIQPHVRRYVPALIAELAHAPDGYTRGKLLELLGDAQDPTALPVLAQELEHPDPDVRHWAHTGLIALCLAEADQLAEEYRRRHPEEFE